MDRWPTLSLSERVNALAVCRAQALTTDNLKMIC